MIQIAHSTFHIDTQKRSPEELKHLALQLFAEYEALAATGLNIDDFTIEFDLENGSLIGEAWIAATSNELFQAICIYGSFFAGVEAIGKHVKALGRLIANKAPSIVGDPNATKRYQATAGDLNTIQNIFHQVRNGTLSEDDAIRKVVALFDNRGGSVNEEMSQAIRASIENLQHYPEQNLLPFIETSDDYAPSLDRVKTRRQTPDVLEVSEELRLKIKVRRESRVTHPNSQITVEAVESRHRTKRRP